jgi:hypothetical protein
MVAVKLIYTKLIVLHQAVSKGGMRIDVCLNVLNPWDS